jgi:hypothetical protein
MAQKQKIYLPTFISSINYDAARVLPHVYFYNGTKACEPYYIENTNGVANQFDVFPYVDNYSGNVTTTSSLSLLFNNEVAVYGEAPSGSLYTEYWEKYVELLYNPRTRIMNCSAIIPLAEYFKMNLNDIVQFRGNHYHLRAINQYNLSNGECELELLGPILGDVLANILPGIQCNFDFDISDIYYGWRIQTCDETPVTYEVTFNTTSSIVPGMIISASSEISGCWYVSGSVTQSVLDYYNVGVYGTYTSCASCSMTPPPPPPPLNCTSSVSWSLSTAPTSSTSTIQIDVSGSTLVYATGSATGNFTLATTSSLDIYGGTETGAHTGSYYSMSVKQNGTSIYEYFGDLFGELHFTSSCSSSYEVFVSSSYSASAEPTGPYYYTGLICGGSIVGEFYSNSNLGDTPGVIYAYSATAGGTNQCFDNVNRIYTPNSNPILGVYEDCATCTDCSTTQWKIDNSSSGTDCYWGGTDCSSATLGGTIGAYSIGYTPCVKDGTLTTTGFPVVTVDAIC